jgi:lysozyme
MKASKKAVDFIKKWESFSAFPYKCSAGVWTIGYGHTDGVTQFSKPITKAQAVELLMQDITRCEDQVYRAIVRNVNLNQGQFDACVSFVFNLGISHFRRANFYKAMLLDPDSKLIADSWITFRNAGGIFLRGLLLRRLEELLMYYEK